MPEHILPLPPQWEKDLDCGWVVFKSGDDDIRGYFAKPRGRAGLAGVVMAPENLGVIEHRQDVTRRLAKAGYAVLTVDPYSRIGGQSPRDFRTPDERRLKAFLATPDEQTVPDLQAACDYLAGLADVDERRVGAIGYCSGGGTLYAWICGNSANLKAAVVFYGAPTVQAQARPNGEPLDRAVNARKLQCPLLVHHGDADRAVSLDEAERIVDALRKSGQPVEFHVYSGADHAYHDDTHPNHHAEAASLSWKRTLEFLERHLSEPTRRAA